MRASASIPPRPPLRRAAVSRLRSLADRLEPARSTAAGRAPAPLVRIGGVWWHRDDIVPFVPAKEATTDVQLLP